MSEFKYISPDEEVELNVTRDEFETQNRKSAKTSSADLRNER